MKTIKSHEILDHGVEHSQYFQGCGLAFSTFDDVATGVGDSPFEAAEDALESLAQNGWDVSSINNEESKESELPESDDESDEPSEIYHYVSIRVSARSESEREI